MSDCTVTMVGSLTRDPELRFTNSGRANANFGLAVNRRYQKDGEWVEEVSFFNCVAWGALGENLAASCTKGTRVIVSGRLEQRSYDTQAGEKRTVVEVVVDDAGPSMRWARAQVDKVERETGR